MTEQPDEQLIRQGRRVLSAEGEAILSLCDRLDDRFAQAVLAIHDCQGKVVLTGVGKAGIIGQKISATLASTGTLSIFLHPVEALHGDLGRLQREDVVIALSNSGTSDEIVRLLDHVKARGATLIGLTGNGESPLAKYADICVCYGHLQEACPLGLAPTVSTSVLLALGDALALTVMERRQFQPEDYAAFHPAGALGRTLLLKVEEAMSFRIGERLLVVRDDLTLGEALSEAEKADRRAGAMLLVDGAGKLSGILTDADLRRMVLKNEGEDIRIRPVADCMVAGPKRMREGDLASEALALMNRHRIDELPVVDAEDRPIGLIDVQDLVGLQTLGDTGSQA